MYTILYIHTITLITYIDRKVYMYIYILECMSKYRNRKICFDKNFLEFIDYSSNRKL